MLDNPLGKPSVLTGHASAIVLMYFVWLVTECCVVGRMIMLGNFRGYISAIYATINTINKVQRGSGDGKRIK